MQQRKCFIFVTSLKVNAKMKNPILSMLFLCMWEWKHIYLGTNIGDWGIPSVWNIISNGSMCHCRMLRRSRPYCIFIQRSLGMNLSFKLCLFSKLRKGESSVMGWCLQFTLSKFSYCSLFFFDIIYSNHHLQLYFKSVFLEHLYSRTLSLIHI